MSSAEPKKPVGGAYGIFMNEKRAELTAEIQKKGLEKKAAFTAVTKLAGERFKKLDAKAKAVYEKKFESAKAQYDKDMQAFIAGGGVKNSLKRKGKDNDSGNKRAKKSKDPDAPKKPVGGAYGCFLNKNRDAFKAEIEKKGTTGKAVFAAVTSLAGEKWKQLSEEKKKPFEREFAKLKQEYDEAMKAYVPPEASDEDDLRRVGHEWRLPHLQGGVHAGAHSPRRS